MNQAIPYSILFFDPNDLHHHPGGNIVPCQTLPNLPGALTTYQQTRITVCVCCDHTQPVLNTLLNQLANVAAIIFCTTHHQNPHAVANRPVIIRENLFNNDEYWQIEAHTYALNANDNVQINDHIQQTIASLLQHQSFPIHGATQQ